MYIYISVNNVNQGLGYYNDYQKHNPDRFCKTCQDLFRKSVLYIFNPWFA